MKRITILLLLSVVFLCSCKHGGTTQSVAQGDTVKFKYASLLQVVKFPDYTLVTIHDPWKRGQVLHRYVLVRRGSHPKQMPSGTRIEVPLCRTVVFTTAHCQLLNFLKAQDAIKGVCDLQYILVSDIQKRAKSGQIIDCGNAMSPMLERIIDLRPDGLLLSPFENSGGYGKLEKLGVPVIEAADYMETSALGRAEWMRFYGMIYGKEREADSLFHLVDSTYQRLKSMAWHLPKGLSVLTERKTGSVWYCPGGHSSIGLIIHDAHGGYAFADDKHSGSLPLSVEEVLAKAGNTDVWAFKYNGPKPLSKSDLLQEYHGYEGLKAFRTGAIYECDCSRIPYFEETPFRPDYLLRDFIILLHPDANLGKLRYFEPMKASAAP